MEIISQDGSRAETTAMRNARRAEIESLLSRGNFKVFQKHNIFPVANVLLGRFVLELKTIDDRKVKDKARHVIGGHCNKLKSAMVHSSQTLQQSSIRLLSAIASMFEFGVWPADVRQVYLKSDESLSTEVYIRVVVPQSSLRKYQCV